MNFQKENFIGFYLKIVFLVFHVKVPQSANWPNVLIFLVTFISTDVSLNFNYIQIPRSIFLPLNVLERFTKFINISDYQKYI